MSKIIINNIKSLSIKRIDRNGARWYLLKDDPITGKLMVPSVSTVLQIIDQPSYKKFERDRLFAHFKKSFENAPPGTAIDKRSEFLFKNNTFKDFEKKSQDMMNLGGLIGTDSHQVIEVLVEEHLIESKREKKLKQDKEAIDDIEFDEPSSVEGLSKLEYNQTKNLIITNENNEPIDPLANEKKKDRLTKELPLDMLLNVPEKVTNIKSSFLDWKQNCGIDLIFNDTIVYSEKYKYAGACDAIGRKPDGSLVVLDWKTSTSLSLNYALQIAAYSKAIEEMTGEKISEAWIVKFHKVDPTYETFSIKDIDAMFQGFLSALNLWNIFNVNKYSGETDYKLKDHYFTTLESKSKFNSDIIKAKRSSLSPIDSEKDITFKSDGGIVIPDKIKKIKISKTKVSTS